MLFRQYFHRRDAKRRVHRVRFLALEIDNQTLRGFVITLNLPEPPAPMYDVCTGFHGLELGLGRLERRRFCNERGNGFGIHGCVCEGLNGRVERTMSSLVKPSVKRPGFTSTSPGRR